MSVYTITNTVLHCSVTRFLGGFPLTNALVLWNGEWREECISFLYLKWLWNFHPNGSNVSPVCELWWWLCQACSYFFSDLSEDIVLLPWENDKFILGGTNARTFQSSSASSVINCARLKQRIKRQTLPKITHGTLQMMALAFRSKQRIPNKFVLWWRQNSHSSVCREQQPDECSATYIHTYIHYTTYIHTLHYIHTYTTYIHTLHYTTYIHYIHKYIHYTTYIHTLHTYIRTYIHTYIYT